MTFVVLTLLSLVIRPLPGVSPCRAYDYDSNFVKGSLLDSEPLGEDAEDAADGEGDGGGCTTSNTVVDRQTALGVEGAAEGEPTGQERQPPKKRVGAAAAEAARAEQNETLAVIKSSLVGGGRKRPLGTAADAAPEGDAARVQAKRKRGTVKNGSEGAASKLKGSIDVQDPDPPQQGLPPVDGDSEFYVERIVNYV